MSRLLGAAGEQQQSELIAVGVLRVLAVPMFIGLQAVRDAPFDTAIYVVLIGAAIYTVGLLLWFMSPNWDRIPALYFVPFDVLVMCVPVLATADPASSAQIIVYLWVVAMTVLFPPRVVMGCIALALVAYLLASLPSILSAQGAEATEKLRGLGFVGLAMTWIGGVGVVVGAAFERRQASISALSAARQNLLADALTAEDRARRRLSQSLHDDSLQTLLAAGQDLDAGIAGDPELLARAREELRSAVKALRETVRGLHPAALAHGGLSGALDAVADRAANQGSLEVDLRVDPDASGRHDALIVSLVRELATNAVKHADADTLEITVSRNGAAVVLAVADDGRGFKPDALEGALATGHIGLASSRERVAAAGGTMSLSSAPERGTTISVRLPEVRG